MERNGEKDQKNSWENLMMSDMRKVGISDDDAGELIYNAGEYIRNIFNLQINFI